MKAEFVVFPQHFVSIDGKELFINATLIKHGDADYQDDKVNTKYADILRDAYQERIRK